MSGNDFLREEIFKRYGTVQRARGCFLYTKKGVRLTDMNQEGGKAILGWGGSSAFTMMKNALSRGVTGSFITEYDYRTKKAVSVLLNSERNVFFFPTKKSALEAGISVSPDGTSFYRPWSSGNIEWSSVPSVVVEPPLPWTRDVFILAVLPEILEKNKDKDEDKADKKNADFQNSDFDSEIFSENRIKINAPMNAGIARSIYNLISAIQERKESDWFVYDIFLKDYFERKGPYLYPKVPEEKYPEMIKHFLDCTVVLSADYNQPSVVPFGADKGVFTKLKNNPFAF